MMLSFLSFTLTLMLKVCVYAHAFLLKFKNTTLYAAAVEVLSEDPSIEVRESNWLRRSFRRSVRRIRKVPHSPEIRKEDDVDDPTVDMTTEFVADDQQDEYSTGTVRLSTIYRTREIFGGGKIGKL